MTYPGPGPQQYYPPGYRPPPVKMVMTVGGWPLAEPMDRFFAYLIDTLILAAIMFVPVTAFVVYMVFRLSDDPYLLDGTAFFTAYFGFIGLIFGIQLIASYVYYVRFQARNGQTVGKRAMKIAVVRQADGGPIDARMARKRWLTQFPAAFLPGFSYANSLWLLWDVPFRQCLHDKTAETVVVKVIPPVKVGP